MSGAQSLIADYLRRNNQDPNAQNITRALNAASINPDLIPGLSVGGTGEYSPGDPRTGGLQPGNAPTPGALPIARPRVSAPTRPQASSAPTGDDVDILGNTIVRGLPPTGTPRDRNEMGGSVPQGAPSASAPTPPKPVQPAAPAAQQPVPGTKTSTSYGGNPTAASQGMTNTQGPEGSVFPGRELPFGSVSQADQEEALRGQDAAYQPGFIPGVTRMVTDLWAARNSPQGLLTELTRPRFTTQDMATGVDVAGLVGPGSLVGRVPAVARLITQRPNVVARPAPEQTKGSVPSADSNAAFPFGKPPPPEPTPAAPKNSKELAEELRRIKLQDEIDNFSPGSSNSRPTPQPQPRPTQAAPGPQGSPTAQAESPTTSTASRPVQMRTPPVHASGNTVPLSQITGGGQDILYTGRPTNVPPMPPDAVAPVVSTPTPQPPFQGARYGTSMKMQQPPTPIRGEITGGETNAYNIPGTEVPITPTDAPTRTPPPTSVPPPVNVAAPTNAPMPVPSSATVPPQLLDELTRLIEGGFPSRPVAVPAPGAPPGATRAIPIGTEPPMVQAINARRQAGPRKELTRSDVKQPRNVAQEMAERLRRK